MNRTFIAGALYSDLRVTGQYVAGAPTHIDTSFGLLPLPPGEDGLLFLTQTTRGPWKFAGKGHVSGATWEWNGGWKPRDPSNGENAFAYDTDGGLHIIAPGKDVTSQGYRRMADGTLASGDGTYGPFNGLNEWAYVGDGLYIGQGAPEHGTVTGVVVFDDKATEHRLLEAGFCTFIHVDRVGDLVAITFSTPSGCVFIQTTIAELRTLPLIDPPTVPITPPTPPVPPSTPEAKPLTNQIETVKRVRAGYPTPLGASHPAFLIEVAKATKAKLLRKDGGTHVTLPNGINVSQDILMFGDQGVDILGDGEGAATPGWGEKGTIAGEYIDVTGISGPDPTPGPSLPPVPDTSSLQAKIALLEASATVLHDSLAAEAAARALLAATVEDLKGRLDQLEGTAVRLGHPITVSGNTGRTYGHGHSATLTGAL